MNTSVEDPLKSGATNSHDVFHVFGLLERILSFVDYETLLHTSLVSIRWKEASRSDDLWKAAIHQCWKGRAGVSTDHPLYWRTLFSQQGIEKLTLADIQSYFDHPWLHLKRVGPQKCQDLAQARRFLRLHMLDVVDDFPEEYIPLFFSDVYFGSFASSIKDSKRNFMVQEELCNLIGFNMFFKVEVDETADIGTLEWHSENTYLYPYTTCFFEVSRTFKTLTPSRLAPPQPSLLRWGWKEGLGLDVGKWACSPDPTNLCILVAFLHERRESRPEGNNSMSIISDNDSRRSHGNTTDSEHMFHVYGLLERILSFVDYKTLLHTSMVNRRWREASRADDLWKAAILQCWEGKAGVSISNPLFWRTLYSQEAIEKLTFSDIQSYFGHPFLHLKRGELQKCQNLAQARRVLQLHMLDLISDYPEDYMHVFFSDVYFGSFASSVKDSKRDFILKQELCSPNGFSEYFKVEEGGTANVEMLEKYGENTYLYPYTTCFYSISRTFWMTTKSRLIPQKIPILRWRWLERGKKLKIANFPALTVFRRKDWGWVLENNDVVMVLEVFLMS